MTMTRFAQWTGALAASLTIVALAGCGRAPYEVAEVDGVLRIGDKPGYKVYIEFIPDVNTEASPPASMAETDAEGHFTLQLHDRRGGSTQPGAVVGRHRVVLRDLQLAESATGAGVPVRLSPDYALVGTTPLTQDVTEGKQTIEIQVPSLEHRSH
jgi:hypothetical protein